MNFEQKEQEILEKAAILNKSIFWWKNRVTEVQDKLDQAEELSYLPDQEEKIKKLARELRILLQRGELEIEELNRLQKQCSELAEEHAKEEFIKNIIAFCINAKIKKK